MIICSLKSGFRYQYILVSLIIFQCCIMNIAFAHLSKTSARILQGTNTEVDYEQAKKRLGFAIGNKDYSEIFGNISSENYQYFQDDLSLNSFLVKEYFNSSVTSHISDARGDAFNDNIIIYSDLSYHWADNNGHVLTEKQLDLNICQMNLALPLHLDITANNVQIQTILGEPRTSLPVTLTKTYLISFPEKCYANP